MAASTGPLSGDDFRLSTSVDTALDAAVLPRSRPVHSVDTFGTPNQAAADNLAAPPIVLQIPDLEALEARNIEPRSWMQSPVFRQGVGMVGSVIVTIIVAAILASFKTHAPQAAVGEAPTWQTAAPDSQSPLQAYGPPAVEAFDAAVAPSGTASNSNQPAPSQSAISRDFQAAPEINSASDPRAEAAGSPLHPAGAAAETARADRNALPTWPDFNPPREEAVRDEAVRGVPDGANGLIYRNPFVEQDEQPAATDTRAELRTADNRAGVGDTVRRDEVRRDVGDAAPVARLKGTIIKSNSDRSYGNTGSSLH